MSDGQWRVLVLLLVLLALEAIANPTVRSFFTPVTAVIKGGMSQ